MTSPTLNLKKWFASFKKEEILEQIVYDGFYEVQCPVCKASVFNQEHTHKEPGKRMLTECPTCHMALYAKIIYFNKILKKYVRDGSDWLGLKLISEEEIYNGSSN